MWNEKETRDFTQEFLEEYSDAEKEFLASKDIKGYKLGKPKFIHTRAMGICILDPHNEIPKEFLFFCDTYNSYNEQGIKAPLSEKDVSFVYDDKKDTYSVSYTSKDRGDSSPVTFHITSDRNGDIIEIKE